MDKELLEAIREVMKTELQPIHSDISDLKGEVSGLKGDISSLKEGLADLKEEVVFTNRRVLNIDQNQQKLLGIVMKAEHEQGKQLQAIIDAQVGYEETHKQHEPHIVKLEKEVDLLDTRVRSLQAAK
ncbi:MAG: hypothetical protein FWG61_01170 [Firmicutes bacterium]|nr:hypothetical protein [Bacillota bacterium]